MGKEERRAAACAVPLRLTFTKLTELGLWTAFGQSSGSQDAPTVLDLSVLPVMNRAMAKEHTSAEALCSLVKEELECTAALKVLRWAREKLEPEKEESLLTDAQLGFLHAHGISAQGFRVPVIEEPSTDFYYAKSFSIAVKGFSSLPPVERVLEKWHQGKSLTLAETLLGDTLLVIKDGPRVQMIQKDAFTVETTVKMTKTQLDEAIVKHATQLKQTRAQIQRIKFAVILGKRWFDEFSSREEAQLEYSGMHFTFKLRDDVRIDV